MKKTLLVAAVLFASLVSVSSARAAGGPVLGVDLAAALPVGNFGDGAGPGFGALIRYEFTIVSSANVTLRGGFMYHLEKNNLTFYTIPVLGGLKIALGPSLYVAPEAGLFANHTEGNGFDAALGFNLGFGYRISSSFDLRVGAEMVDVGHAADSIALFASLGYNF